MKTKILAQNKDHLRLLIEREIKLCGHKCNLNHIKVINITDMEGLFYLLRFNGDISEWDVSSVTNMSGMFCGSLFNSDISRWNVSSVVNMNEMFYSSEFNKDLSDWNVSSVKNMRCMFSNTKFNSNIAKSPFNQDISSWDISDAEDMEYMFYLSKFEHALSNWCPKKLKNRLGVFNKTQLIFKNNLPYWATVRFEFLEQAIESYCLQKNLIKNLDQSLIKNVKPHGISKI